MKCPRYAPPNRAPQERLERGAGAADRHERDPVRDQRLAVRTPAGPRTIAWTARRLCDALDAPIARWASFRFSRSAAAAQSAATQLVPSRPIVRRDVKKAENPSRWRRSRALGN